MRQFGFVGHEWPLGLPEAPCVSVGGCGVAEEFLLPEFVEGFEVPGDFIGGAVGLIEQINNLKHEPGFSRNTPIVLKLPVGVTVHL